MDATSLLATSLDFQVRLPAVEAWVSPLVGEEGARVIAGLCAALSEKLARHQTIVARRLGEEDRPGSAAEVARRSALAATAVAMETPREGDHRIIDDFECFARVARLALAQAQADGDEVLAAIFDDMPDTLAVVPDLVRELSLTLRPPETSPSPRVANLADAAVQRALATVADLGLRVGFASWNVWGVPMCDGFLAKERALTSSLAGPLAHWLAARGELPDLSARAIAARSMLTAGASPAGLSFVETVRALRELHAPLAAVFGRARDLVGDEGAVAMLEMGATRTAENAENLADVAAAAEKVPELNVPRTPA